MKKTNYKSQVLRIIDANINRAKEGIRVCEDIMRLIINDAKNTQKLKKIRHAVSDILDISTIKQTELIKHRQSQSDVGRRLNLKASKKDISEIFLANSHRIKESLRVLEEISNIFNRSCSTSFQNLRFKFYTIEKDCLGKIKKHLSF